MAEATVAQKFNQGTCPKSGRNPRLTGRARDFGRPPLPAVRQFRQANDVQVGRGFLPARLRHSGGVTFFRKKVTKKK